MCTFGFCIAHTVTVTQEVKSSDSQPDQPLVFYRRTPLTAICNLNRKERRGTLSRPTPSRL